VRSPDPSLPAGERLSGGNPRDHVTPYDAAPGT
jgi:hypothetical protein